MYPPCTFKLHEYIIVSSVIPAIHQSFFALKENPFHLQYGFSYMFHGTSSHYFQASNYK